MRDDSYVAISTATTPSFLFGGRRYAAAITDTRDEPTRRSV